MVPCQGPSWDRDPAPELSACPVQHEQVTGSEWEVHDPVLFPPAPPQVSAPFRIERAREPLPQDNTFTCPISRAVVPARGKLLLPVRFSPQTVGVQSVDYFSVVPAGGLTRAVLKVMGSCKGIEPPKTPPGHRITESQGCWEAAGSHPVQALSYPNQ